MSRVEDLGQIVGPGVPVGGTEGQILVKNSNNDYDFSFANTSDIVTPIEAEEIDTMFTLGS